MIQINPLKSYIDGGVRAAITTPPSASLVFDLPGKAIWVKGVKLKGTDHTYTFSHDNYITLTNTSNSNESEDIKIGVNTSALKNAIDTTYGVVSTTINGLAPKFTSENKLAALAATTYYFLGWTGSTLKWYQAPFRNVRINSETTDRLGVNSTDPLIISSGNGISVTWDSTNKKIVITNTQPDVNHNTHYTTMLYIGENNDTKANKNVANPYLKLFDDSIRRATFQIKAGSGIAVTSDVNGNITITNSSPDVNHNTDRTGIKLTTVSGTKKIDSTLILANSATGLNIQGGTNKFLIGDGTNYIEVPITPSFTVSNKDATIGTTLTTIATIAGVDIKAKIASYSLSNHTHSVTINGSTKTITTSGTVDLGNYLSLSGGTMNGTAWIRWADSGNISNNNEGVTFPVIRGGLQWNGQTDYIKLFSEETGRDNLNLVLQFGDDNSNGLSIRDKSNIQTSYISSSGVITTGTFKGNLDWSYITNKPSSYTPSTHTHAWNSLTHSSTTLNQAILTNGSANGWKLYTLNISGWDNAANNVHSHSNKSVLDGITSALVSNWNIAYNFVNTISGTDTDKVINKWDEIVNFLVGITEDDKLNTLLNSKLSILLLTAKDILTTKTNNALFWVNTISTASSITTGPFTDHPYALLSVTNYSQNDTNGKFFYRSRLAFSSTGDLKIASCHHQGGYKLDDTWYNVLTSKNSGISGSTIKLNGTSITVYSSSTADSRFVKKTGDTMSGALNFANNTWNKIGDDSYIGDCNTVGMIGIKAANTTYPGIAFFNNENTRLGNLTVYSNNIKYRTYSLQFLDNGNTSVSAGTWMNPFSTYNASAVADGQAICVWGQSSYLSNLASDSGDMSLWLRRVNANAATLNMVLDGEYYANGNLRLAHVSEIPNSLKNPHALTISLNGTSQGPYDGSAAKNINITPSSIGAATAGHNHDDRYYTKAESNAKYITDITTSINKLTFTRNGSNINKDITVNVIYSLGNLTNISDKDNTTKASSGLFIYNSYNLVIGTNSYSSVLSINTGGTIQIAGNWGDDLTRNLYWRSLSDRAVASYPWKSWRTILDNENYSSILDSRYYTKSEVNTKLGAYLPLSGGTVTGNIILKGGTSADMTYTGNIHPYIRFDNSDSSLNISLIFTDYDAYRSPAGIKLVGNQGNEWFEATNIYANMFYGTLSGNATSATTLQTTRTLWGLAFNGSANVSGNMSGVGLISFSALSGTNGRALLYQGMADNDFFRIYVGGTASNSGYAEIATADDGNEPIYVRQYTGVFSTLVRTLTLLDGNGNTILPGSITSIGFRKNGSSDSYILLGGGGHKLVSDFATSNHNHDYLRGHRLGYRHLDAGPKSSWSDSRLYIGYNGFNDDNGVTDSIGFYRSTGTGTYTRTLWAEINSNGLYANNRFGVNGQNTGYNFYVNGTSLLNNVLRIQYNTPNLYIRNIVDTSYSIIRFGTNSNENASYIFQNGPSRTDDGGANTMTIRNNVGYLRLDNSTSITGLLTVSSGSTHKGIKIGNNYINAINGELIIQNNTAIRFGDDSWDYNVWAGLKYNSSNKTIYLGLADKTIFNANSALSGGSLRFPGISIVYAPTFSGNLSGNASTATALTTSAGSATLPIYFNGGKPIACTASSIFSNLSNSGNNISVTVAGLNRTLTVGYATTSSMLKTSAWHGGAYTSSDTHYLCLGYMNCTPSYDSLTLLISSAFWGNQHGSQDIITILQDTNTNSTKTIQTTVGRLRLGGSVERTFYYYKDNTNLRLYLYVYVTGGNSYGKWNISYLGGNATWVNVWQTNITKDTSWINIGYSGTINNADTVDGYHATTGRTFNGNINWSQNWNDVWSDGTNNHPWYGFDHRYPNTGAYSTTISDFFGMTIKTASTLRLDFGTLLLNGTNIYNINVASATKLQTARTIWGQSFNGTANIDNTLRIRQTTGNYCEGIRIQTGDGTWATIILGATADSGTNTNAWSIHRKADNNFAISRNSSDGVNGLVMTSTGMGLGTTAPTHRLDVRGDTRITGSIRDLAIGGGIYWNPYVESTTDSSDAASITVVRSGVAGGTTLVLSLMNDSNDTILFKTNTAARLYHNSYPILTTLNTYVSNNKGYINGVEITLVNNADKLDGYHLSTLVDRSGENLIIGTTHASTIGWKQNGWSGGISTYNENNGVYKMWSTNGWHTLYYTLDSLYASKSISFSFDIMFISSESTEGPVDVYVGSSNAYINSDNYKPSTSDSWEHKKGTFTLSSTPIFGIMIRGTDSSGKECFYRIKNLKVELGNLPTIWTPAHADITWDNLAGKPSSFTPSAHTHPYLPLSGGTMTGALNFKNGTWNLMGDDAYIGDCNVAGMIGIKGANAATPGFALYNNSGTLLGKLYASSGILNWSGGTIAATTFSGNASSATKLTSSAGNATLPIYFSDGKPIACIASSVFSNLSNSGNNISVTVAGQNRTLTVGYANNTATANRLKIYTEVSDNTNVYRIIGQQTLNSRWTNKGLVLAVASRHSGVGIYTIHYGAEVSNGYYADRNQSYTDSYYTFANVYCKIRYFGDTHDTNNLKIICHVKPASGDKPKSAIFTFFLHSNDGSSPRISILQDWGSPFELIENGATMSTIDTSVYGLLKESTVMNESNSCTGNSNTSNRTKFLETFKQGSTTDTWGSSYPIWAQWSNSTNVRLKCTNYTVWTDKADYASSAGNADTLDGYHANGLLTALSNSNNGVSIIVGGTTKSISNISVNYANSAGNADKVDGQHFNWNNNKNDHTYLWAASDNGNAYLVHRASISVNYATYARYVYCTSGNYLNFQWSGLNGQPTWLFGSNDGLNVYVWNPSNFSVYKANKSDQLEAYTSWGFTDPGRFVRAIRYNGWHTRLYMGYYRDATLENTVHVGYADDADTLDGNHASAFALVGHTHNYDNVYSKLGHTHDDRYYTESEINSKLSAYLPLAGGTMTGLIKGNNKGGSWILGRANAALYQPRTTTDDWHPVVGFKTKTGSWEFGNVGNDDFATFSWESDSNYNSGTNTNIRVNLRASNGTIALTSEIPTVTNYYWANMKVSSSSSTSTSPTFSTCYTSNWFRSTGLTGWYNETYAGGWYMTDTTWVRTYNSKGIYTNTGTIYNLGHAWLACNNGYNVGIGTTSPSYKLHVSGDSYATGWSRAASGFYCQDTGVHFTHNGTKGQIAITSNNEFCWGAKSNILYFNYATASLGTTVTLYVWNAGSSSSYASHTMGHITLGNGSYLLKRVGSSSSWYNGRDKAIVRQTSNAGDYCVMMSSKTTSGSWEIGNEYDDLCFTHITDSNYNSRNNNYLGQIVFTSDGEVYAAHFYENSDIRYKKILKNLSINSNTIANLPLFDFEWIENNSVGTGTSAQAVQQILPNLVSGTDKLTLDYGVLGTIAGITACKELEMLKSELLQLKEKVKLLEDKLRKYTQL